MTNNKNLKQVLTAVVKDTLLAEKGSKSKGLKLTSHKTGVKTVYINPFSL